MPLVFRCRDIQRVASDDRHVHDVTLIDGLAWAFYWQHLLDTGAMKSGSAIARAEKLHHSVVNELLRLTLLAPDIIDRMMAGSGLCLTTVNYASFVGDGAESLART